VKKSFRYILYLIPLLFLATIFFFWQKDCFSINLDLEAEITEYPEEEVFPDNELKISVIDKTVYFNLDFKGGAGLNEGIFAVRNGNKITIRLRDMDFIAETRLAIYHLQGEIKNLDIGDYQIEVYDNNKKMVSKSSFTVN
jgi:hypothetical protein